jgi:exopolyphosphatase/guanosine-5'-triphosphate,3'-diphosphate pyrophosphatase
MQKMTNDKQPDSILSIIQDANADMNHAAHTTQLALTLFDALSDIHEMGSGKRLLLQFSAMLHDIGWSRTTNGGHHKHSRNMILEAELPELSSKEKNLCALIARYHNRAEPDASHHSEFAALKNSKRFVVSWCAAILRVADGLDCNHNGKVQISGCNIDKKKLTILLAAGYEPSREIRGAKKKGALLSRMAGRELAFLQCS